jgi:predicted molibdopterin-dependent oxidoreductase YjgC
LAWKSIRYEPGGAARVINATLAEPDVTEQLAKGNVVVVAGRANLAESQESAVAALAVLLAGLPGAKVLPALRRGNVVGAIELGLTSHAGHDGRADHDVSESGPDDPDDGLRVVRAAADGKLDLLVLLGADPINDCPDADLARRALAGARRVISIDTFLNGSNEHADVVLAAAAYGEKSGTTTNIEGRVTTVAQKITPAGTARPDWMIAVELANELGHDLGFGSVTEITDSIAANVPAYAGVTTAALINLRGTNTSACTDRASFWYARPMCSCRSRRAR